jgi:solute carrier family 25 protein 16
MTSLVLEVDNTTSAPRQGMPSVLINDAPRPPLLANEPRQMDAAQKPGSAICPTDHEAVIFQKKSPALCPTDDDTLALEKKKPHKQSFEYIWRSGVAGGLAGSAVCLL